MNNQTITLWLSYIATLLLINPIYTASDPVQTFPANVNPSPDCSAFCMYTGDGNGNLISGCNAAGIGTNGACTVCDDLLFTLSGNDCVPHLNNN